MEKCESAEREIREDDTWFTLAIRRLEEEGRRLKEGDEVFQRFNSAL